MNPADPNTLLFATYARERDLQDSIPDYHPSVKWSLKSAIYKTTGGGKTIRKLTKGLPTMHLGRIGLDYHRKNPNILFACVESELIGMSQEQIEAALKRGPSPERTGAGREDAGPLRPLGAGEQFGRKTGSLRPCGRQNRAEPKNCQDHQCGTLRERDGLGKLPPGRGSL
jgi:hypothetical protein